MAGTVEPPTQSQGQPLGRGMFPPEFVELMRPPLEVGAYTGTAGVLAGVGGAIISDTSPFIGGMLTGVQWFALGGSYWFTRSVTTRAWGGEEQLKPMHKTLISTVSGSAAGAVAGVLRGPKQILPSMALWSVFGAGGQIIANQVSGRPRVADEDNSWMASRWIPLQKLSDQEYMDMLGEKMLRVKADMALIDDRIAEIRRAEEARKQDAAKDESMR